MSLSPTKFFADLRSQIAKAVLMIMGWKLRGPQPKTKKFVGIVAPHTSLQDWLLIMLASYVWNLGTHFLAKKALFKPILGTFVGWVGGIRVDRTKNQNLVSQMIERFKNSDEFVMGLAPEGTRRRTPGFKSGYYQIAFGARVPIVCVSLDYKNKTILFHKEFIPTGNYEKDKLIIQGHYRAEQAKYPEQFGL